METDSELIAKGDAFVDQKRFTEAIPCYEQALAAASTARECSECLTSLGHCYLHLRQIDKALDFQALAIAADPENHSPHANLGIAYSKLGRLAESRAAYEKAIAMAPDQPQAYVSLGTLELVQNNFAAALQLSQRAIEVDEACAGGHVNLAMALAMAGRFAEADESLKKATARGYLHSAEIQSRIDRLRSGEEDHGAKGHALFNQRKYAAAIPCYEQALAAASTGHERSQFLTSLGNCYKETREFDKAIDYHNQALAADPTNHTPHVHLGIVYTRMNRLAEARSAYEKAIEMAPEYAQAHGSLATLLMKMGDTEGGIRHYERAIELNDAIAESHASLALALTVVGRFEEADRSLERAVQRGYQRTAEVRTHMDRLRKERKRR